MVAAVLTRRRWLLAGAAALLAGCTTAPPETRGVTVDIGREPGGRVGVPVQFVVLPRVAEVVAASQRGDADLTLTKATAERAERVDFSPR